MDQDVPQWLTEIQSLQQRLSEVSQERSVAYEQIARWQCAYQTEAQQRRKDLRRLQTVIYRLDKENKRLKQQLHLPPDARSPFFLSNDPNHLSNNSDSEYTSPSTSGSNPEQSVQNEWEQSPPPSPESPLLAPSPLPNRYKTELQEKLHDVLAECDRLSKALSQEQADHEQTRQTLMTALGDTIEQLERERQRHTQAQQGLPSAGILVPQSIEPKSMLPGQQKKRLPPAPPSSPT